MADGAAHPYPHIKVGDLLLPDCSKGVYRPFRISGREKREIVRALAEKGLSGLDEYINRERMEGAVGERIDEIRRRISEQVERLKASRREDLEAELSRLGSGHPLGATSAADALLADETSFRRFASGEVRGALLADDLIGMLEAQEAPRPVEMGGGYLARLWYAFLRFLRAIWRTLRRFVRWLTSPFRGTQEKERRSGKEKGAVLLPFPGLAKDLERWEGGLERMLPNDRRLQKAVNQRISDKYGYSSGMVQLRSRADPEWYRKEAEALLREEVARKADEAMRAVEERRRAQGADSERRRREEAALEDSIYRARKRFVEEVKELDGGIEAKSRQELRKELLSTLAHMGLLERKGPDEADYEITEVLVERFSELLYAELRGSKWGHRERRGRVVSDTGVYDKDRLRTVDEESRMDILTSITNGRINHPGDREIHGSDMVVLREVSTSELHAVVLVDISGSMEENGRLEAARRAALALVQAVKRDNPRNMVDIVSVSTRARMVTLREVMKMEPQGFTNMQEAFAMARGLLESSRADRRMVFVVTDGLPEAYTGVDGEPVAGDLPKAMDLALSEVGPLGRLEELSLVIFLLEPKDPAFLNAAKRLAEAGSGSVITADPAHLAAQMLGSYYGTGNVLTGV